MQALLNFVFIYEIQAFMQNLIMSNNIMLSRPAVIKNHAEIESSNLMRLFEEELKFIYWSEKSLLKAFSKIITYARLGELINMLSQHRQSTETHVLRLKKVFEILDKKAVSVKCGNVFRLIKNTFNTMEKCVEGTMCDIGIISSGRKIVHYKIATYVTLWRVAESLGMKEIALLLEDTLKEVLVYDKLLTKVTYSPGYFQVGERL